jgi:hypothetical protein
MIEEIANNPLAELIKADALFNNPGYCAKYLEQVARLGDSQFSLKGISAVRVDPNLVEYSNEGEYTFVISDIHGRYLILFKTLTTIFSKCPNNFKLILLGDYVDRARNAHEIDNLRVICVLLYLREKFPNNIKMLRGNHETDDFIYCYEENGISHAIKSFFGGLEAMGLQVNLSIIFNSLPCYLIYNGWFLCHGGPVPLNNIDQDLLLDALSLLWSDPIDSNYRLEPNTNRVLSENMSSSAIAKKVGYYFCVKDIELLTTYLCKFGIQFRGVIRGHSHVNSSKKWDPYQIETICSSTVDIKIHPCVGIINGSNFDRIPLVNLDSYVLPTPSLPIYRTVVRNQVLAAPPPATAASTTTATCTTSASKEIPITKGTALIKNLFW